MGKSPQCSTCIYCTATVSFIDVANHSDSYPSHYLTMTGPTYQPGNIPILASEASFSYFDLSPSSPSFAASSAGSQSSTLSEVVPDLSARKAKGIQVFRKLTLRKTENSDIQKRLTSAKRIFSLHEQSISELDQASDDVLELTK
jgi:hypothetical protein